MARTVVVCIAISVLLAGFGHAQHEVKRFDTAIADSIEEAVEYQRLDALVLPNEYRTNLFCLNQPIHLLVRREVRRTYVVGRYIQLDLARDYTGHAINKLVVEACRSLPYSGWRENANEVGNQAAKEWGKLEANGNSARRRSYRLGLYDFFFDVRWMEQFGESPRLTISLETPDFFSVNEELEESSFSDNPKQALAFADPMNRSPANALMQENRELESKLSLAYSDCVDTPSVHHSSVDFAESRWPYLTEVDYASSFRDWSTMSVTCASASKRSSILEFRLKNRLRRSVIAELVPKVVGQVRVSSKAADQAQIIDGWHFILKYDSDDDFDRVLLKFRKRDSGN